MSKGTPLIALRVNDAMINAIDAELARRNNVRLDPELNRSSWIRAAITEKIRHIERSRRSPKKGKYPCFRCEQVYPIADIAWKRKLLTGGVEYCCGLCDCMESL